MKAKKRYVLMAIFIFQISLTVNAGAEARSNSFITPTGYDDIISSKIIFPIYRSGCCS